MRAPQPPPESAITAAEQKQRRRRRGHSRVNPSLGRRDGRLNICHPFIRPPKPRQSELIVTFSAWHFRHAAPPKGDTGERDCRPHFGTLREPRARGPLSFSRGTVAVSTAKINRMGFDSATLSPQLMNRASAARGILRGFRSFVRSTALSPFPSPTPTNPGGRARYPKIRRPERAQKSSRGASVRRPAAVIVVQPNMFVPYR